MEKHNEFVLTDLICQIIENRYNDIVGVDAAYSELKREKDELIGQIRTRAFTQNDQKLLFKLIDAFEAQIFLTLIGLDYIRILDISKLEQHE